LFLIFRQLLNGAAKLDRLLRAFQRRTGLGKGLVRGEFQAFLGILLAAARAPMIVGLIGGDPIKPGLKAAPPESNRSMCSSTLTQVC